MNKLAALAIALLLLVALGAGYWLLLRPAPETPSQVWVKGRGTGQTIRLYPSGRFESSSWCDVCPPDQQVGTWSETQSAVILRTGTDSAIMLNRVTFHGCSALVRADAPQPRFPTDVFFPVGDLCGDAL